MPLTMKDTQYLVDLRRDGGQMDCMGHRQILQESAGAKSRPVKGVGMYEIKFILALAQLEKQIQKNIGLRKETRIGGTLQLRLRETGGMHALRHIDQLNGYIG